MGVEAGQRQQLAENIRRKHRNDSQRQRIVLTIIVIVGVLASAGFLVWNQLRPNLEAVDVATPQNATDDYGFALESATSETSAESASAPIEIKLYEDFLCPSCKIFLEESGDYLKEQLAEGNISITYYPIAFLVNASSDEYSQRASNAAVCVADQAGVTAYAAMHNLLMQNQPAQGGEGLTDQQLIDFATEAGAGDITECIENRTFEPWLEQALAEAKRVDVTGTPTVRVDGVNVVRSEDGAETIPGPEELAFAVEALQ